MQSFPKWAISPLISFLFWTLKLAWVIRSGMRLWQPCWEQYTTYMVPTEIFQPILCWKKICVGKNSKSKYYYNSYPPRRRFYSVHFQLKKSFLNPKNYANYKKLDFLILYCTVVVDINSCYLAQISLNVSTKKKEFT